MPNDDTAKSLQRDLDAAETVEAVEQYREYVQGRVWLYQEARARAIDKLNQLLGHLPLRNP